MHTGSDASSSFCTFGRMHCNLTWAWLQAIEQIQRMRHSQDQQAAVETEQPPDPDTNAASNTDQNGSPQEETPSRKRPRDDGTTASHPTVAEPAVPSYATVYDNGDSYTKLRPGVFEMLEALRHRCELRIFTMGNPQYACAMASLIDSSGALFRNRIVARDDADPAWRCKGLQKAGAMPALTAIIDDTVGAPFVHAQGGWVVGRVRAWRCANYVSAVVA